MPHIHEKIDWCIETFIVHQDKVLLRRHDKYERWLSVGGHIELDEGPLEAAKRECLEEVGLAVTIHGEEILSVWDDDVKMLPKPICMYRHPISNTHEHIGIVYFGSSNSAEVVPEDEDDVWQWFTKEEIAEHQEIKPHIKKLALQALQTLSS